MKTEYDETTVWPEITFHTTIEPPELGSNGFGSNPAQNGGKPGDKPDSDEPMATESAPEQEFTSPTIPSSFDIPDLCGKICDQYCQEDWDCSYDNFNWAPGGKLDNCNTRCQSDAFMFSTGNELSSLICPIEPTTASLTAPGIFTTLTDAKATTTTQDITTMSMANACDDSRTFDCPDHSKCAAIENGRGYTCICDKGYSMTNNFCKKDHPEVSSCPDNFRDSLYKMKLDSLKNPMFFMNEGTVLIQVESQVVSRFRSVSEL